MNLNIKPQPAANNTLGGTVTCQPSHCALLKNLHPIQLTVCTALGTKILFHH